MTDGELYPRLFITGTGVRTTENSIVLNTGADSEVVEKGIGYTLSNPCVGTLSQAYDVGLRVAQAYAGVVLSTSRTSHKSPSEDFMTTPGSRYSDGVSMYRVDSATYKPGQVSFGATQDNTFADFNTRWAGKKFSDFNTYWAGRSFEEHSLAPLR